MKLSVLTTIIIVFPLLTFGQQFPPFKVKAIEVKGLTIIQTEKMKRATVIFEKVMNDMEFQEELKIKTFKSDRPDDLIQNPTSEQVIEKIYGASEPYYQPETNHTADIYWYEVKQSWWQRNVSNRNCKTIGYSYLQRNGYEQKIFSYDCFLGNKKTEFSKIVGHIAHEWSHKLGFQHQTDPHPERPLTVPYTFGDLVAKYAEKYI